jgi:hypothetical protein
MRELNKRNKDKANINPIMSEEWETYGCKSSKVLSIQNSTIIV